MSGRRIVAVVGDTHLEPNGTKWKIAEELGEVLINAGYRVVTGGIGDLPRAVAKGARKSPKYADGSLVAILPGFDPVLAEETADIVIATGMDQARNIIVANSDAVIAIGGGAGTLSEIAHAWALRRLIVAFDVPGWSGELGGRKLDGRQRSIEVPEDQVFKVTSCEGALNILREYLHRYRRHSGIHVKE